MRLDNPSNVEKNEAIKAYARSEYGMLAPETLMQFVDDQISDLQKIKTLIRTDSVRTFDELMTYIDDLPCFRDRQDG